MSCLPDLNLDNMIYELILSYQCACFVHTDNVIKKKKVYEKFGKQLNI